MVRRGAQDKCPRCGMYANMFYDHSHTKYGCSNCRIQWHLCLDEQQVIGRLLDDCILCRTQGKFYEKPRWKFEKSDVQHSDNGITAVGDMDQNRVETRPTVVGTSVESVPDVV